MYDSPAALQAAQDAAIFGAQARHDEAEGLQVKSIEAALDAPGRKRVTFSDGEKVLLSKRQIAALRSMNV